MCLTGQFFYTLVKSVTGKRICMHLREQIIWKLTVLNVGLSSQITKLISKRVTLSGHDVALMKYLAQCLASSFLARTAEGQNLAFLTPWIAKDSFFNRRRGQ